MLFHPYIIDFGKRGGMYGEGYRFAGGGSLPIIDPDRVFVAQFTMIGDDTRCLLDERFIDRAADHGKWSLVVFQPETDVSFTGKRLHFIIIFCVPAYHELCFVREPKVPAVFEELEVLD